LAREQRALLPPLTRVDRGHARLRALLGHRSARPDEVRHVATLQERLWRAPWNPPRATEARQSPEGAEVCPSRPRANEAWTRYGSAPPPPDIISTVAHAPAGTPKLDQGNAIAHLHSTLEPTAVTSWRWMTRPTDADSRLT
jgi:hypothetical protein